jgi:hypothetical protein
MIFLLPLLFAEEPKYKEMKEGDIAPWAGRLLNESAMRILVEDAATKDLMCEAKTEFQLNNLRIEEKYRYDVLKVQTDAEINKLNELIILQDEHIQQIMFCLLLVASLSEPEYQLLLCTQLNPE